MLPYSCINCDVSEKWRHQLLGSWRRSLLQILKPLLDEKSDKSSYDKISSKVEHIQSLQVFMKEIQKLRFSTDRKSSKFKYRYKNVELGESDDGRSAPKIIIAFEIIYRPSKSEKPITSGFDRNRFGLSKNYDNF